MLEGGCKRATGGDRMTQDLMMEHQHGDGCGMNCGYNLDQVCDGNKSVKAL